MITIRFAILPLVLGLAGALLGCSASDGRTAVGSGSEDGTGTGTGPDGSGDGIGTGDGSGDSPGPIDVDVSTPGVQVEAYQCVPKRFPNKIVCEGESFETESADNLNWGEAMQKALWFFNLNKSGAGVFCTDTQWRGDAHVADAQIKLVPDDPNGVDMSQEYIDAHRQAFDPDGNGMIDASGGFYDAGDFIKFGLTTPYAATMVAWSMHEFPNAYQHTGLEPEALAMLRWFADYFMRNTYVENGEVVGYVHQVGDADDHTCGWMPPEVRLTSFCPRKAYLATHEKPASDVTAAAAASLAIIGKVFYERNLDVPYAEQCLLHAMALYRFASQYPKDEAGDAGGLYEPEYSEDELSLAAVWLADATGDWSYIDDVVGDLTHWEEPSVWKEGWLSEYPGFGEPANDWAEGWTYVWRSARSAAFLKLAEVLMKGTDGISEGAPARKLAVKMKEIARNDSLGAVDAPKSPGGFSLKFAVDWGSGRYNSAMQFMALTYAKYFPEDERAADIKAWAKSQSEYLLGKNPLNKSYMMGYTNHYCTQPHHAAGHASLYGEPNVPTENRHILYGALVNGPTDFATDGHVDNRGNYAGNEVTIDYNGAFLAALASNYESMGSTQCPLTEFPPLEPRIDEFYTTGKLNNYDNQCYTQAWITLVNESIHPPRYDEHLSIEYYLDVTEFWDAGADPSQIFARLIYDRGLQEFNEPTSIEGPIPCEINGNMYYVKMGFEGYKFWGLMPKLKSPRSLILETGVPSDPNCIWDPYNDWSLRTACNAEEVCPLTRAGCDKSANPACCCPVDNETYLNAETDVKNPHVTVYSSGELIYGEEPPCHEQQKIVVPPDPPVLR